MIRRILWPVLQRSWQWITGTGEEAVSLVDVVKLAGSWSTTVELTGTWSKSVTLDGEWDTSVSLEGSL